ncbi:N-6 DNA methylase [Phormidium tenue FACHB-886]|nr:N-6 DNA methylase [Phormidium tenue FACHB-886]
MSQSLLKLIRGWQKAIINDLTHQYPDLAINQCYSITQTVIVAVLALYLGEQRAILLAGNLQSLSEACCLFERLHQLWRQLVGCNHPWQQRWTIAPASDGCLRQLIHSLLHLEQAQDAPLPIACLGQVYECLLSGDPTDTRKARGSYYTPEAIVDYILQNTLKRRLEAENSPLQLKILDPACGGGIFLLSAYQLLMDWYLQIYLQHLEPWTQPIQQNETGKWSLTLAERSRILQDHIYGIDIDPDAVLVTKLCLDLQRLEGELLASACDLSENIVCKNTILDDANEACFDVVIGNPPYIDSEWMTAYLPKWRSYCITHYKTAIGNWDLFCIFIEKALALCKPDGFTSLVVPNKLASANYAAAARSLLTQQTTLLALRDYSRASAFSALVYPLVYVAQRRRQADITHHRIWYEQMESLERVCSAYSLKVPCSAAPWLLTQQPHQFDLLNRLSQLPKLASFANVTGAATVAEAYAMQPFIQDSATAVGVKLVNSGTIDRYRLLWGEKPMRYLGQSYRHPIIPIAVIDQLPPKRYSQAIQPKIIVAGMTRSLECALDAAGTIWAGKSTTLIRAIAALDLRCLLGILNSRLIQLYFSRQFAGNQLQGGYLRVGSPQLRQLPMPLHDSLNHLEMRQTYQKLIGCVDQQLALDRPDAAIDEAIDQLVYQLYGLTDSEIEAVHCF